MNYVQSPEQKKLKMNAAKTLFGFGLLSAASAAEPGVLDLDINVTERPHKHHSGLASHLMSLSAMDGTQDYIEKNLDNFFNI